jgi:undecaprenyl-diphosphatase
MPAISRRLVLSGSIAAILVAVWLTMMLAGTGSIDRAILVAVYAGNHPAAANLARIVTLLGDGRLVTIVAVVAGLWLMRERRLATAVILLVGTGIGRGLTEIQKIEVNRLRPDADPHLVATYTLSYPSAHSANAMMTYLSLALLLPRARRGLWIAAALILAVMVGASRVVLGVHWPSDVMGGWVYGALWTWLLVTLDQIMRQSKASSKLT